MTVAALQKIELKITVNLEVPIIIDPDKTTEIAATVRQAIISEVQEELKNTAKSIEEKANKAYG